MAHLQAELYDWMQLGDQIILMIDANEDVQSFAQSIQQTGLQEVLLTRHGNLAPTTYHNGSSPIDGIFASPSIDILISGYFEFGFGPPTDHHRLWIDIHNQVAFGHTMPPIMMSQA